MEILAAGRKTLPNSLLVRAALPAQIGGAFHFLSLGVAVPLGSQALNLKLNCCIGIVSHDPVPLAMKTANFRSEHGGAWAFLWRNLGGHRSRLPRSPED